MKIKEVLKSDVLKEFLNDTYLDYDSLTGISKVFLKNVPKSIKLEDFFKKEKYYLFKSEIRTLRFKRKYSPEKFSFSICDLGENFGKLFYSKEFLVFLGFIIGKEIEKTDVHSFLFKHKDYTLLEDEEKKESFFEINLFFNDQWREESGGYFSYISKDEEVLRVLPTENSLVFIFNDINIKTFVKYVNANSGKRANYFVKSIIL